MPGINGTPPRIVAKIEIVLIDDGSAGGINVAAQVQSRAQFLMMMEEAKVHVLDQMCAAAAQKVVMPPPGLHIPRV